MQKRESYKRIVMFLSSLIIWAAQILLYAYVWDRYYNYEDVIMVLYWRRGNWAVIGTYAMLTFLFERLYGGYKVGYLRNLEVIYSQVLSVICVNALTYLELALIGRWKFLSHITPILGMTVIDILLAILWVLAARHVYSRIYPPRHMLYLYGDRDSEQLYRKFETRRDKYLIQERVRIDIPEEELFRTIDRYETVLIGDVPIQIRNQVIKYCYEKSIRCYAEPKLSDIMVDSAASIDLFDTPLLLFRNRGLTAEQKFTKRALDILFGVIGLVLASPFMLIIAIAIKLCDGGPVFYRQERLTKDGKIFRIYKFRSMYMDSEKSGARLAMKNDSRVTPVGKIIRNIHFDELPQLFNILQGDMSIVGPRPERPSITEEYSKQIPEFKYRLKVKAGLTGYAQVYGKYNTTPYDKLKFDLTYIENYSLWLDIKLVLMTVKILFQKENTEGVEEWQTTALRKDTEAKK